MKKDNWRFEALARAKIAKQEEEAKNMKYTKCLDCSQMFNVAINYDRCRNECPEIAKNMDTVEWKKDRKNFEEWGSSLMQQAIAKAEGRE